MEVDFFNMDSREIRSIGHGGTNMCTLFKAFHEHVEFEVDLFQGKVHVGTVSIRGQITELHTCLGRLFPSK
jgi:hypothetical protein